MTCTRTKCISTNRFEVILELPRRVCYNHNVSSKQTIWVASHNSFANAWVFIRKYLSLHKLIVDCTKTLLIDENGDIQCIISHPSIICCPNNYITTISSITGHTDQPELPFVDIALVGTCTEKNIHTIAENKSGDPTHRKTAPPATTPQCWRCRSTRCTAIEFGTKCRRRWRHRRGRRAQSRRWQCLVPPCSRAPLLHKDTRVNVSRDGDTYVKCIRQFGALREFLELVNLAREKKCS